MNRLRRRLAIVLILLALLCGGWMVVRSALVRRADLPRLILDVPYQGDKGGISVSAVSVSPNGKIVAAAEETRYDSQHYGRTAHVFLWNADTGRLLRTLAAHRWVVWNADFSPDSRLLLTTGADNTLKLWRVDTGVLLWSQPMPEAGSEFPRFAPGGQTVAGQNSRGYIDTWDVRTGRLSPLPLSGMPAVGKKEYLGAAGIAFSPNGRMLAATLPIHTNSEQEGNHRPTGGEVRLWDTRTGRTARTLLETSIQVLTFSPDGQRLATAGPTNSIVIGSSNPSRVQVYDVYTGRQLWSVTYPERVVTSLVFLPKAHVLAALCAFSNVRVDLLNADTGVVRRTLSVFPPAEPSGFMSTPNGLSVSTDGRTLISRDSRRALVWDTSTLLR